MNQRSVNAIKPGPRRIVWDDEVAGFGIQVTPGACSYIVNFRLRGKMRRHTLGSTSTLKYLAARDDALDILHAARKGVDATAGLKERKPTYREVWQRMLDEVDRPRLAAATIDDYTDRSDRLILPRIGDKPIGDVSEADVDRIVSATTGQRNRAYAVALIRKTINFAKRDRVLDISHRNPTDSIKVKKRPSAAKALELDDIAAFGRALAEQEHAGRVSPWLANLFRLSLLCGLRPGEVRTLRWGSVNLPKAKMSVVGKTGEREIYLTEAAIEVLKTTPRVQGCEYVFAGRRFGQPIVGVHKVLKAVQAAAGVERFRPYDFRHSAATGALASGADVRAVQALLGHADLKTTAAYLHSSGERRRQAAERAANFGRGVLKNG